MDKNYFEQLMAVNVNDKIEKKGNLSYLAWAYAWGELKKMFPNSYYTIYENDLGWFYHTDNNTCWVKTGVTLVDGDNKLEHIEYLPVMDFSNKSVPLAKITSFDVNKTIQRSLTKAVARHGLGLYVYAGEDLPDDGEKPEPQKKSNPTDKINPAALKGLVDYLDKAHIDSKVVCAKFGIKQLEDMTEEMLAKYREEVKK